MPPETTPTPTSEPIASPLSAAASAAPSAASPSGPADGGTPAAAPARPEGIPDDLWDNATGLKTADVVERLKERDTLRGEADARRQGVPEKADGYELKLPADITLPEGMALNPNDPRLAPLRDLAHKAGLNQDQFSAFVALDVAQKQADAKAMNDHVAAQAKALGANAAGRVDAVTTWLTSVFDPATARDMASMTVTSRIVEGFERLQTALSAQGIDTLRTGERTPATDPTKIPGYATMSMEQKLAAADAKQAAGRR